VPHSLKYLFNVYAVPAPNVPGDWLAHCLELDLMSQGSDALQAIELLKQSIAMLVGEAESLPPFEIRDPPAEAWQTFSSAPVFGQIRIEIVYRWERDASHPTVEIRDRQVELAG